MILEWVYSTNLLHAGCSAAPVCDKVIIFTHNLRRLPTESGRSSHSVCDKSRMAAMSAVAQPRACPSAVGDPHALSPITHTQLFQGQAVRYPGATPLSRCNPRSASKMGSTHESKIAMETKSS